MNGSVPLFISLKIASLITGRQFLLGKLSKIQRVAFYQSIKVCKCHHMFRQAQSSICHFFNPLLLIDYPSEGQQTGSCRGNQKFFCLVELLMII